MKGYDLRRAFGPLFWFSAAMIALMLLSNVFYALGDEEGEALVLFEMSRGVGYAAFFMPLFAALPFSGGFARDYSGKFYRFALPRAGRRSYFRSKILCCALSGGGVAALGTLVFAAFLLIRFPPQIGAESELIDAVYFRSVLAGGTLAGNFAYYLGCALLQFFAGALWALSGLALSAYLPLAPLALVFPMLLSRLFLGLGDAGVLPAAFNPAVLAEAGASVSYGTALGAALLVTGALCALCAHIFRIGAQRRINNG